MIVAHKIALKPNNAQATGLVRACGVARFAYNWALAEWQQQYAEHKADPTLTPPSEAALRRKLNAIKRDQFPWMLDVTKNAPQMAIIHLGMAFANFFAGRTRYPAFKKKGANDRFSLTNDQMTVNGTKVRIPKIGWVRMHEPLRFSGKILSATISRTADVWFISVTVETITPSVHHNENQDVVGVDLGVLAFATLSTGEVVEGPKAQSRLLDRLRRMSKRMSRKRKGSANRRKAKVKLSRLHARISNIRMDATHKLTSSIVANYGVVCIEDLHVRGMMKNRHLSRALSDMGFAAFRQQLEYKGAQRGVSVIVANRWFASSKTCSCCGEKTGNLTLDHRNWTCESCGECHDRDINAAINLRNYAMSSMASACGGEGSGTCCEASAKPSLMKQEVSSVLSQDVSV